MLAACLLAAFVSRKLVVVGVLGVCNVGLAAALAVVIVSGVQLCFFCYMPDRAWYVKVTGWT